MASSKSLIRDTVKRRLAAAKAAKGYTWDDIAKAMTDCGMPMSSGNLMTKNSRGMLKATEWVLIMRVLGLRFIDLSDLEIPGLAEVVKELTQQMKHRGGQD